MTKQYFCKLRLLQLRHIVSRILQHGKSSTLDTGTPIFRSHGKNRKIEKRVTNLDDFEKDVLRRTIYEIYDNGEYPMLKSLFRLMREKKYRGSITSMIFILQNLGFRFKRTNDGMKYLLGDIVATRLKFIRTLHNLRASGDSRLYFILMRLGLTRIIRGKTYEYGKIRLEEGVSKFQSVKAAGLLFVTRVPQALDIFLQVNGFFVLGLKI